MIDSFTGKYRFLSNFYETPITHDGISYPTTEHAFQAAKTLDFKRRWEISNLPTPGESKKAGRLLTIRPDWEQVKYHVMFELQVIKFGGSASLRAMLAATRPHLIVEGNRWHDQIWGSCTCDRESCRLPGLNHLGRVLVLVRERLT